MIVNGNFTFNNKGPEAGKSSSDHIRALTLGLLNDLLETCPLFSDTKKSIFSESVCRTIIGKCMLYWDKTLLEYYLDM